MEVIVQIIYFPAQQVIRNPALAFAVAFGFACLLIISMVRSGKIRPWIHASCLLTCALWVAFGTNEFRLREVGGPIRVDLLLLWPPLLLLTLATAWRGLIDIRTPHPPAPDGDGPRHDLEGA